MSWDAPPPGEPQQPTQPYGQPTQPYGQPTQPYAPPSQGQPTQPYGQPVPNEQPTAPYPAYPGAYGQPGPNDQPPPQWTQPQPDQYGQPSHYGQPGQPGGAYLPPYPLYPTAPPPKRSRTGFYALLGVIAVVVAAGVAVGVAATSSKTGNGTPAALGTSSSTASAPTTTAPTDTTSGANASQSLHTLVVPTSAGPLNLLTNADTAQRTAKIVSGVSGNAAYLNPKIGFYAIGSDSSYSVWMLAESTSDVPAVKSSLNLLGDAALARQIAKSANMTAVTTESPGPLGGALLCGKFAVNGAELRVCEWVDESSYGWVYFMPSVKDRNVLTYTLDLRRAAEQ